MKKRKYRILSIDAWAGESAGQWDWNNWFHVGDIEELPESNRAILKIMRDEGYLSDQSKGRVSIDDDQYNIVICDKSNNGPLYAIEYGNEPEHEGESK